MSMLFRKHLNIGNEAWHCVKCQGSPVITCLLMAFSQLGFHKIVGVQYEVLGPAGSWSGQFYFVMKFSGRK